MPARFFTITDPGFSEYLFHCMRLASPEKKANLNANELKYFKNDESIRRFAENETMDKRLLMLVRLGYSFTIGCYPEYVNIGEELAKVEDQYEPGGNRHTIIEAWAKEKIFFLSSRDLSIMAHMAAQNSHSQVYVMDYMYLNLRDKLDNYRVKTLTETMRDSVKSTDDISKIILNAMCAEDVVQSISGCNREEMKILLALYPLRNTVTSHDVMADLINEPRRSKVVGRACYGLVEKNYIAKEPTLKFRVRSQNYMIMEQGITAVMNFMKYVLKKALKE